jgi:SNF family Na+-dependent transporter
MFNCRYVIDRRSGSSCNEITEVVDINNFRVFFYPGVGYGALIAAAWLNVFYIVVLAWAIYYLVSSFALDLPWASCGHWWNTVDCRSEYVVCNDTTADDTNVTTCGNFTSPVREFWE